MKKLRLALMPDIEQKNGSTIPAVIVADCGAMLRTALRGKLTLHIEHEGKHFLLDTEVEPPKPHGQ